MAAVSAIALKAQRVQQKALGRNENAASIEDWTRLQWFITQSHK
jgi:hypothetical protein